MSETGLGQAQLLERQDRERHQAERPGHRAALHEQVGAEPGQALHAEREVELLRLLEGHLLRVGEDRVAQLLGVDRGQRLDPQRHQLAVDAQLGRRPGGEVQVRRALVEHDLQELVQAGRGHRRIR
jgi:hypothetical protein